MSDTITAWHDMQEEQQDKLRDELRSDVNMYIYLLDFVDGKVYRYDISALCNEHNAWNPDHESCEAFLYGAGHSLKDCEWMVTNAKTVTNGN